MIFRLRGYIGFKPEIISLELTLAMINVTVSGEFVSKFKDIYNFKDYLLFADVSTLKR